MAGRLSGSIRIGAFAVTAALLAFGVGYRADAATPPPSPGTNGTGAAPPSIGQQAVGDPEPGATLESSGEMVVGVQPSRLLDTRDGTGARAGKLAAGESISVKVTGRGGVPDVGVAAVVLNVTGTEASEPTFLTAWPTGATRPNASNLNLRPGADTPNAVVVKVGRDGMVDLFNFAGATHVLADVTGWIPIGFAFTPLVPSRVLDTRDGTGAPAGAVGPGGQITLDVTGVGGVPDSGVGAVVLNITGTEATAPTFVTVWPDGERPNASSLNLRPGVDTPNLVIARVGADGAVRLFNFAGSTHLIADVEGWIAAGPSYQPLVPSRVLDTRQGIGAVPANGVDHRRRHGRRWGARHGRRQRRAQRDGYRGHRADVRHGVARRRPPERVEPQPASRRRFAEHGDHQGGRRRTDPVVQLRRHDAPHRRRGRLDRHRDQHGSGATGGRLDARRRRRRGQDRRRQRHPVEGHPLGDVAHPGRRRLPRSCRACPASSARSSTSTRSPMAPPS